VTSDEVLRLAVELARGYLSAVTLGTVIDPQPGDLVVEMTGDVDPNAIGWLVRYRTSPRVVWIVAPLAGGRDRRWGEDADFWKVPDPIAKRAGLHRLESGGPSTPNRRRG
jgi:hypothetical protein